MEPDLASDDWGRVTAVGHPVDMVDLPESRPPTQLALASLVRPGDQVLDDGRFVEIVRVKRAQGRKPARGENLRLVGDSDVVKVNSLDAVRIRARGF